MDAAAYDRLTACERACLVAIASGADMLLNFPLWIAAKRISAGLPLPTRAELYKGSSSLWLAMGPMTVVEDGSTALVMRTIGERLDPEPAHAASASASGAIAALFVGSQVEGVITRAHSTKASVAHTAISTLRAGGVSSLIFPSGMLMCAAREVPYAGCLFYLSGHIRGRLASRLDPMHSAPSGRGAFGGGIATLRDALAATMTAAVAGPISHVPSVIASYQQAHAVGLRTACGEIWRAGGIRRFWGGLLPRSISLSGSLFIMPFAIETLQPLAEELKSRRSL